LSSGGVNIYKSDMSVSPHPKHSVQFYEDGIFFCTSIARFAQTGLKNGEGVLIVANPRHCRAIEDYMISEGENFEKARKSGQLRLLDAESVMKKFLVNNLPQEDLFLQTINELITKITRDYPKLRVYGEMVNVMWMQGNLEGMLILENLWNKFMHTQKFSLLCGYEAEPSKNNLNHKVLEHIYDAHAKIISRPPPAGLAKDKRSARAKFQKQTSGLLPPHKQLQSMPRKGS
jgi:hypothetical protein